MLIFIGILLSSCVKVGEKSTEPVPKNLYERIIESECAWLASIQYENGAIPMYGRTSGTDKVCPYFSYFAVLALLECGDQYTSNAKRYIEWHFDNLNDAEQDYNGVDGTIYDFKVTFSESGEPELESLGSYDSTDAYASTFLHTLRRYYEVTGDKNLLLENYDKINRVVNAMMSTYDDGLTWGRPDYQIKYLMDNCEVFMGMESAALLYRTVLAEKYDTTATALILENAAATVRETIDSGIWNEAKGAYLPYLYATDVDLDTFYADATAQLWVIICKLHEPSSERIKTVYESFNRHFSTGEENKTWEKHEIPDPFYWASMAWAGALMGDKDRVDEYLTIYETKHKRSTLHCGEAGFAVLAAAEMIALGDK
ncbi:MAG: hypothetical protein FWF15_10670 [Oscillospiraceae bacterium]|nr:hypothetical protein [Oscillospiraceae bacterium]